MSIKYNHVYCGDCREVMSGFPEDSVDLVVTSPPFWGLRDYGEETVRVWGGLPGCEHEWGELVEKNMSGGPQKDENTYGPSRRFESSSSYCVKCNAWCGSLGLEPHPQMFIDHLVEICREIKRVLKLGGSFWLNLGDTYYTHTSKRSGQFGADVENGRNNIFTQKRQILKTDGWLKEKQLLGIPWRVAAALQDDGWILRNCVVWYKRNHMPESVRDRLTKSYEFFFFFVKQPKYYFNLDEIREPYSDTTLQRVQYAYNSKKHKEGIHAISENGARKWAEKMKGLTSKLANTGELNKPPYKQNNPHLERLKTGREAGHPMGKNPGDMWDIPTQPFKGAHFAVFPTTLVEPIIKSSSPPEGIVLDPFAGSGTALRVARKLGRRFIGIEVKPEYAAMCERRVKTDKYVPPPKDIVSLKEILENV